MPFIHTYKYVGLTAHSINQKWELVSPILQTREEIKGSAILLSIWQNMCKLLSVSGIYMIVEAKVVAIATDSASNMVAAAQLLPRPRVLCTAQLVLQEGFTPAVAKVTCRCRELVGQFKHSYTANRALEAAQVRLGLPQKQLIREVHTRCYNVCLNDSQNIRQVFQLH